jgi:hypothetical protein
MAYDARSLQHVKAVTSVVEAAFVNAKRFTMLSRTRFKDLENEIRLQTKEGFINGKRIVARGNQLGAEYLVLGYLTGVEGHRSHNTDAIIGSATRVQGTVSHSASATITLSVVEVESGRIIATDIMKGHAAMGGSVESAIQNAIKSLAPDVETWTRKKFPITVQVLQMEKRNDKRGLAETVLLEVGELDLPEGRSQTFRVIRDTLQAGSNGKLYPRKIEVGRLRLLKSEGDRFSVCRVNEGGKEIYDRLLRGERLRATTL